MVASLGLNEEPGRNHEICRVDGPSTREAKRQVRQRISQSLWRRVTTSAAVWMIGLAFAAAAAPQGAEPAKAPVDSAVHGEWVEALPLGGIGARAAALLMSDQTGGEVDGAVTWTSDGSSRGDGRVSIQFYIELAGDDLLADTRNFPVSIEIFGYVIDDEGALQAHISQGLVFEGGDQAQRLRHAGLKFVCDLEVPPGSHVFRVLVVNRQTDRFFLGGCDLGLPAGDPAQALLLPPLISDPADTWTIGIQNGLRPDEVLEELPGTTSLPSAKPIWRLGEPLEMVIGGTKLTANRKVGVRLFDRLQQQVLDSEIEVGPPLAEMNGLAFYRVSIGAPDIAVGEYRFAVVVTDGDDSTTVSQSLPMIVFDSDSAVVWSDQVVPRAPRSQPPSSSTDESAAEDMSEGELAASAAPIPEADTSVFDCPDGDASPPTGPIEGISLGAVGARGAALLLSGQSGGDVEGAVIWTSSGGIDDSEEIPIQFMVEVNGQTLLSGSPHFRIPIEVYGYLIDKTGTVVRHLSDGILIEECRRAQMIEETGLKYVGEVSAPPGLYSFRIVVRNRLNRRFFLARRDLDLRTEDPTHVVLLPPLVSEERDGWVMAGKHGLELASVRDGMPGIQSWPSAMPVWRGDESLEMVLGCSELSEERRVAARLFDRLGQPVLDPEVEVGEVVSTAHGLSFYRASVAAPDLPVGEYRFAVILTDSASGHSVTRSLPILIHDRDAPFLWTDEVAPRVASSSLTPARVQPSAEELEVESMRAAYIEALRLWSRGDEVAARRALADLELALEAAAEPRSWRQMITVERLTALTLAKSNPATLMAVALLHSDMFNWYLARRESQLASHSWRMTAMIARVATTIEGWQPPGGFSECVLLDLAGRLVRSGQRHSAQQLLETAVDLVPESAPARLGLGALYERTGYPEEAVNELKTLYKMHPEHFEGRLRLAVNRTRLGEEKAAEELLRGLVAPSSPLWIRTLAYQELGRLLIEEERVEEAEALLREGVALIPGNQRLQILLAHLLDQTGRPKEAETVVDQLSGIGSQHSVSPRYRYSVWPDLDADRVRTTLKDAQAMGLEALREAIP